MARDFFLSLGGILADMKSLPAKGGEDTSGAQGALCEWNGSVLSVLLGTREAIYWRLVCFDALDCLGRWKGRCFFDSFWNLLSSLTWDDGSLAATGDLIGSLNSLRAYPFESRSIVSSIGGMCAKTFRAWEGVVLNTPKTCRKASFWTRSSWDMRVFCWAPFLYHSGHT